MNGITALMCMPPTLAPQPRRPNADPGATAGRGLTWPADPGSLSRQTCGYRTRKPCLFLLGGLRRGALRRDGFESIQPDAAALLAEREGTRGVVLGTSR